MSSFRLIFFVVLACGAIAGCDNGAKERAKHEAEAAARNEQSRQEALSASRSANAKDAELLKGLGAALEAQRAKEDK